MAQQLPSLSACPTLGSISAALGNEKTESNIICVSACAAATESKSDTSSSKQRDYSSQRLGACDNKAVADLVSALCFLKALRDEINRSKIRDLIPGAEGGVYTGEAPPAALGDGMGEEAGQKDAASSVSQHPCSVQEHFCGSQQQKEQAETSPWLQELLLGPGISCRRH